MSVNVVKMDDISEHEELSLYTEFLHTASEFVEDCSDNEEFFNELEEKMDDGLEDTSHDDDDDDDHTSINIMQCMTNLIDLEYISQAENPEVRRKGEKRWGVHPLNQLRREQGHFDNLFNEMLRHDHEKFFNFTRMTPERFQHLFEMIETKITKTSPNAIPSKCRLLLTLRCLATGDSLKSLHYNFRVGISTAYYIIRETCDALWDVLQPIYLKFPEEKDWLRIEKQFREKLNLPNCVGALDGKLIEVFAPAHSGSLYFNYSKYFSTNLLAICDALKSFIYVDIGSYGQQTDGGILFHSTFGKRIDMKKLNFPSPSFLPHTSVAFPFFVLGDSAFPLKKNLLTPYAVDQSSLSDVEANFNKEQSSVRKIIENAFAILVRRWQIFSGPIEMHPANVDKILKATIVLHNFIKSFDDPAAIRYMREERCTCTYSKKESLCSFYKSGLRLAAASENEYASAVRNTYANYLMNVL